MKLLILALLVLTSCSRITIDTESIKLDQAVVNGFTIQTIKVDSIFEETKDRGTWIDSDGLGHRYQDTKRGTPIFYEVTETVHLIPTGSVAQRQKQKQFYFNEINNGYEWYVLGKGVQKEILVQPRLADGWYRITRLPDRFGGTSCQVFLEIREANVDTYELCNPAP